MQTLLIRSLPLFVIFLLFEVIPSRAQAKSCAVKEPSYIKNQVCYSESLFDNLQPPASRKEMVKKFAPLAVYLQTVTGFPASVLVAHIVKEQGWKTKAPGNNFYGIMCMGKGSDNFATPTGHSFNVQYNGCGTFQKFASAQDSMLGYINLMLYRDRSAGSYRSIRNIIPDSFPPPADSASVIDAIARSPYCQAGCPCSIGSYGKCMKSHIKMGCLSGLDNMILCNYDYPILKGLPDLHVNIRPSKTKGQGSAKKAGRRSGSSDSTSNPSGVLQ